MAYRVNNHALLSLTPGTPIDGTNTGPGGNAYDDAFAVGTGNTLTYEEVSGVGVIRAYNPLTGTDGNNQFRWNLPGTTFAAATEVEYSPNSWPVAQLRTIQFNTATGYAARIEISNDGVMMVYTPGTGANNDMVGTVPIDTGSGFRILFEVTTGTAGSQTVRATLYNGSDGKSTSASETLSSTTATTQTDALTLVSYGGINNAGEGTIDYRNIQLEDAAIGVIGPLSNPVVGGTETAVAAAILSGITGGDGGPYSIVAASQTGGTSIGALSYSGLTVWGTILNIDEVTLSVTVEDGSSNQVVQIVTIPAPSGTVGSGEFMWNLAKSGGAGYVAL